MSPVSFVCWGCGRYQVATGSGENMVKLWDLRRKKNYYTLPAHTSLISSIRYATL